MLGRRLAAACIALSACGGTQTSTQPAQSKPAIERFVDILLRGGSLYGLDAACSEWRTTPGDDEINMCDAPESECYDPAETERRKHEIRGGIKAQAPDGDGRIYGFSYFLASTSARRLRVTGRGSWSPAPGVTITDPKTGYALIGTGAYCAEDVEVREAPDADAIRVGDQTWFLSRDACLRPGHAVVAASQGCSSGKTAR